MNAAMQVRIISYLAAGILRADTWLLYVTCAAIHVGGMLAGDRMVRRVNQTAFNRFLLLIMLICVVLLFCAAFGIASQHAAPDGGSNSTGIGGGGEGDIMHSF